MVVGDPTTASAVASVTVAEGLDVDVTRVQGTVVTTATLQAGTAYAGKVRLTDGTTDATIRDLAANDALNVAIVDGAGNQVTSFGGSGGTSSSDDADFTQATTPGTPIIGVYESTPTSVTDNDMGIVGIDVNRRVKVSVDASTLDVAHDAADSGNPVKVGAKAANALPTAVANNDRANNVSDLFGRLLVGHIAPEMQVWKSNNYTSAQTGGVIWDPTAGKRIAITSITIGAYATTAARLILWFGANAVTVFVQNTHQVAFAASFAPSATVKPGAVLTFPHPIFSLTADYELHITTDAALSVDVAVHGYEF
jgi:hypothetical protein